VGRQQRSQLPGPAAVGGRVEEILRVAARILVSAVQYQRPVLLVPEAQALDRAIAAGCAQLWDPQGNRGPVPASVTGHVQEVSVARPAATLDPTRRGIQEDELSFRASLRQMVREPACVCFGKLLPARAAVGRPVDGHHVRAGRLQTAVLLHQEPTVLPVDEVDRRIRSVVEPAAQPALALIILIVDGGMSGYVTSGEGVTLGDAEAEGLTIAEALGLGFTAAAHCRTLLEPMPRPIASTSTAAA